MVEGTKIDELFISLGLDLSQLDKDFVTADNTVKQGITKLSQKQTQTKLRMEIDMSRFAGAENSTQALAVKTQYLNQQLDLQKQKIALVNAAYLQSVQAKGADSAASQRLLTNLLREQNAEASLAAQIRQANAARASGGVLSGLAGGASTAINQATSGFAALQTKLIGIMAIAATGAGLFNVVKGAVDAGNAVYQMSNKLHISTAEAADMSRILKMGEVDSQAFIGTMIRLDRAVETAGKSGNTTTNALKEFGISLTDANGELLPMNQQLAQLAKGYENAAKAGQEEAYVSELLGARGQALLPVLQQYNDLKEASSRVATTGLIDPDASHKLKIDLMVLSMEATQLGNAFGAALMPIAKEVAPQIIDGMKAVIQSIRDNKDGIAETTQSVVELTSATFSAVGTFSDWVNTLIMADERGYTLKNTLLEIAGYLRALEAHPLKQLFLPGYDGTDEEIAKIIAKRKQLQDIKDLQKDNADWVGRQQSAQKDSAAQAVKTSKSAADAQKQIALDLYKATHTAYENEIKDIENKAEAYRQAGVDEATVAEFVAAETTKASEKNGKDEAQKTSERQRMITDVYGTALEKRLAQIDEEKNKYIQAGIDEAQAREMVEKQKLDAIKDYSEKAGSAIRGALMGSYGAEINAVKDAILKGTDIQTALQKAREKARAETNATNRAINIVGGGKVSPEDLALAQYDPMDAVRRAIKDSPNYGKDNNSGVEVIRGTMSSMLEENNRKLAGSNQTAMRQGNIITVSPTIQINNPHVESDQDIAKLADKVADVIRPAVLNAIGGSDNSY